MKTVKPVLGMNILFANDLFGKFKPMFYPFCKDNQMALLLVRPATVVVCIGKNTCVFQQKSQNGDPFFQTPTMFLFILLLLLPTKN